MQIAETGMRDWRNAVWTAILIGVLATALYQIRPSFFWRDDFQAQYLPGSAEVARGWRDGTIPLLTQSSWFGAALGAEYQYGVFSIVRGLLDLIVWALPLTLTGRAAVLFIVHAMIAAAGAFLLARSYGIRTSLAAMVAVVASLNGSQLWWGTSWFPTIASFAWLPWYWLALRRIIEGRSRWSWLGAALSLYLLITAGWPYGVAMAVVVAMLNFAIAIFEKRWRAALILVGGSALGLALASPAAAMLLEYVRISARGSVIARAETRWVVPPAALFGFVLPGFAARWSVWAGTLPHPAVELLGGFIPLIGIAIGARRTRFWRERSAELIAIAILLILMMLPGLGTFRWSFRWLPLFHLLLAIAGAYALEIEEKARPAMWGLILIAVALLGGLAFDHDFRDSAAFAAFLAAMCVVWLLRGRSAIAPVTITVLSIAATFVLQGTRAEVPVWTVDDSFFRPEPFDPARRYLSLYEPRDIFAPDEHQRNTFGINAGLRPSNMPMLARLHFINGYTPLGPAALHNLFSFDVHGCVMPFMTHRLIQHESAPGGLLHHLGIDGLVVPNRFVPFERDALIRNGWIAQATIENATIFHRRQALPAPVFAASGAFAVPNHDAVYDVIERHISGGLPIVLVGEPGRRRYGFRELRDARETRLASEVTVKGTSGPALVVFRRPWLPGWRATLDGNPLNVIRADLVMPAVEIPNGADGKLRLVYRPASLIIGGGVAGASLLVILAISVALRLKT